MASAAFDANVERVALVVVERSVVETRIALRRGEGIANQSAGNGTALLLPAGWSRPDAPAQTCHRVGELNRQFPSLNQRAVNGDGEENVRLADVGMVEEVVGARFKIVRVKQPPTERNLHAELMLLIALAVQRKKGSVGAVGVVRCSGPEAVSSGGGW